MNVIRITDLSAPGLAPFARLTEAQLRSRRDPEKALFIAESAKVISHALDAGCRPVTLLMEERQLHGEAADVAARCGEVPVYVGERELLKDLTGYALTRGVLCTMARPRALPAEQVCAGAHRVAVLEGIVDPTNVGSIFRSAAALGMDAVLLDPTCCDPLHRRAVRVSMGTVFQVPWATLEEWPEGGLAQLRAWGFRTAALALDKRAIPVDHPDLAGAEKLALVLGTEGDGLSAQTVAACDDTVMIPMHHGVDSLNVGAAAAVAFWQFRQR